MSLARKDGKTVRTPPPRPLSESVSQPDIFRTPDVYDSDSSISLRKRKYKDDSEQSMNDMFNNVLQMFKELKTSQDLQFSMVREEIGSLKSQNLELLTVNTEIKASVTQLAQENQDLKNRVENLEKEAHWTEEYVKNLEIKLENVERKSKSSSVEISNISVENHQQMLLAIEYIHKTLKIDLEPHYIREAYRIPTKSSRPKPIIVEFLNIQMKDSLLRAAKGYSKTHKGEYLDTKKIGLIGENSRIFINELLTTKARHLHYMAREFTKKFGWKFCWTKRGKIYNKKTENSSAIEVTSEEQLGALEVEEASALG